MNSVSFKLKKEDKNFIFYEKKGDKFEVVIESKSINIFEKVKFDKENLIFLDLMIFKKGIDLSKFNFVYVE